MSCLYIYHPFCGLLLSHRPADATYPPGFALGCPFMQRPSSSSVTDKDKEDRIKRIARFFQTGTPALEHAKSLFTGMVWYTEMISICRCNYFMTNTSNFFILQGYNRMSGKNLSFRKAAIASAEKISPAFKVAEHEIYKSGLAQGCNRGTFINPAHRKVEFALVQKIYSSLKVAKHKIYKSGLISRLKLPWIYKSGLVSILKSPQIYKSGSLSYSLPINYN